MLGLFGVPLSKREKKELYESVRNLQIKNVFFFAERVFSKYLPGPATVGLDTAEKGPRVQETYRYAICEYTGTTRCRRAMLERAGGAVSVEETDQARTRSTAST